MINHRPLAYARICALIAVCLSMQFSHADAPRTSDFHNRAVNYFTIIFPYVKSKVAAAVDPAQSSIVNSTTIRIDPKCVFSPANATLSSVGPIITICSRNFRYFFEFVEWNAMLSAYELSHELTAESISSLLYTEWSYLQRKSLSDRERANHDLPQEVVCLPYIRLYMNIKEMPIKECEQDAKYDEMATAWVYAKDGLFEDDKAAAYFSLTGFSSNKEGKSKLINRLQNLYIGWAYKFILLHEFGHILNNDLGGAKSEKITDRELNADRWAISMIQQAFSEDAGPIGVVTASIAEMYYEPFNENSALTPIDRKRAEAAIINAQTNIQRIVDAMTPEQKAAIPALFPNLNLAKKHMPAK